MQTPNLQPKLDEAVKLISSVVTEANDAVILANEQLERTKIDVRAAEGRLAEVNKEADKAKRTFVAVTQRITERTQGYKATLQEHSDLVVQAEDKTKVAQTALNKVLQQLKVAQDELDTVIAQKTTAEALIKDINDKIAAGNQQYQALVSSINEKTADKSAITSTVRGLISQKNTLEADIKELETTKSTAQANADHELATVLATIKVRRTELAKVEQKIKQFNEYMDTETKVLEAKQRLIEREQSDIKDAKRKIQSDRSILTPME